MSKVVKKASELDLDKAVQLLMENELGILLVEADKLCLWDKLAEMTTFEHRQGMHGNGYEVTHHLYPIRYKHPTEPDTALLNSRMDALYNVFHRWTFVGHNKRHAKNPFKCKAFMQYLEEIGWHEADYLLLMVQ